MNYCTFSMASAWSEKCISLLLSQWRTKFGSLSGSVLDKLGTNGMSKEKIVNLI